MSTHDPYATPPTYAPAAPVYSMQQQAPALPTEWLTPPPGHGRDEVSIREAVSALRKSDGLFSSLAAGALLSIIPIVGIMALHGWAAEISQRVHLRNPNPIPRLRLQDFSYWLKRGVPRFVVSLIAHFAMQMALTIVIMPMYIALFFAELAQSTPLLVAVMIGFGLVTILLSFVAMVFQSALLVRADLTEDIGQSLKIAPAFEFGKRTFRIALVALMLTAMLSMVLVFAGMLFFFVGIFFAIPASVALMAHVRTQIYEVDLRRTGKAIPVRPPQHLPMELEQMQAAAFRTTSQPQG